MFGKILEEMIKNKYENKTRFAEECGISKGHLSDIITGRTLPREDNLKLMIEKLRLSKNEEELLIKEWSFDKTGNMLRDKYEKLEKENAEMLKVLKSVENEKTLMKKIEDMKNYEEFYESVFKNLTAEEQLQIACSIIDDLDATEANITGLGTLIGKIWDKQDLSLFIEKLQSQGYTVEKTAEFSTETLKSIAENLGMIISTKPLNKLTPKEIYEKAKAEFARENEREETKKKIISMFPPVLHKILEFSINKAYEEEEYNHIIEFSETDKSSMAAVLKEFSKEDSPFKKLFENIAENKEFSTISDDPVEQAKKLVKDIGGI